MPNHQLISSATNQSAERAFREFCKKFPETAWSAGSTIIEAGRSSSALYFLTEGCVKMSSTSSLGDTVTLHIFYPDSCFPFLSFINPISQYDLAAVTDVHAHKVPVNEMAAFLREQPDVSLMMNVKLLKGMQGLLHRIEQSVFVSAYYQVAGILYYFAQHFADQKQPVIALKVTHKDISEWLGLSRENVSLQMKQLERDGIIARQGQLIEIANFDELKRLATPQDLLL